MTGGGGQGTNSAETYKTRGPDKLNRCRVALGLTGQRGRGQKSSLRDDYTAAGNIGGVFDGAREESLCARFLLAPTSNSIS